MYIQNLPRNHGVLSLLWHDPIFLSGDIVTNIPSFFIMDNPRVKFVIILMGFVSKYGCWIVDTTLRHKILLSSLRDHLEFSF